MTKIKPSFKQRFKKFFKIFLICFVALVGILFVANKIWIGTGSGEWELSLDKNGTKVYSKKTPGSSVTSFKVHFRSKLSTSHFVAGLLDLNTETCAEWAPVCTDVKTLEPWNPETLTKTFITTYEFIPPIPKVEMILKGQLSQNRETRAITLDFNIFPDLIPHNECCYRLTHMSNTWVWTPLENGETDVVFIQDVDMSELVGGWVPNYIINVLGPHMNYSFVHDDMPRLFDKEKYARAEFDFIENYIEELRVAEAVSPVYQ